jgi:hypothetical protein
MNAPSMMATNGAGPPIAPGRACGACSECCRLLHVVELEKPAGVWCDKCRPGAGGCSIYETRPSICRTYACAWLMTTNVGDDWYPLKCNMIISIAKIGGVQTVTVTVDPDFPLRWREPGYHAQLRALAKRGLVVDDPERVHIVQVRVDNRVWLVLPGRDVEVTKGSYVLKLRTEGEWDVEFFDTQEEAAKRTAELSNLVEPISALRYSTE